MRLPALGVGAHAPVLTIVLAALLAGREELRGSLPWLAMVPLVVGFLALFVRLQRYRGP